MKAIFPLSADPIHKGHIHIIEAAAKLFDEVHVAIGENGSKGYTFSTEERLYLAHKTISTYIPDNSRIIVESFDGSLKNHALLNGYTCIVRGARNEKDFSSENVLSKYHEQYGLQTIVIPATDKLSDVSSTLVRELVKVGGFVNDYVHPAVKQSLEERLGDRSIIAVAGSMGSGKSTFCRNLIEYAKTYTPGITINHIDIDKVVKSIYSGSAPLHQQVREEIKKNFGDDMFDANGINRKKASEIMFNNPEKEKLWTDILKKPLIIELEELIHSYHGIVLLDAAYIVEKNLLPLTNYNVMLVNCDDALRYERIMNRDHLDASQVACRTKIQLPHDERKRLIIEQQNRMNHGKLYEIDTTHDVDFGSVMASLISDFPLFKRASRNDTKDLIQDDTKKYYGVINSGMIQGDKSEAAVP
jgi:pantetheine-phosphate adenylyltransferase